MRGFRWLPAVLTAVVALSSSVLLVSGAAAGAAATPVWTVQRTVNPSTFDYLTAVACASADRCIAVGATATSNATAPLIESWNGTTWSKAVAADPLRTGQAGNAQLTGVSCPLTSNCIAVGTYSEGTNPEAEQRTFSDVNQGGGWKLKATATLSGVTGSSLAGVSCASTTYCLAVGAYDGQATAGPLSESWNGSTWTLIKSAAIGSSNASFSAAACSAAGTCTAVGTALGSSNSQPLIERLKATTWTIESSPDRANAGLYSVACPSVSRCLAVGAASNGTTLAEGWNGTAWSVEATPTVPGGGLAELVGISCTVTTNCRAVGTGAEHGQASTGLAERWNGSTWSLQTVADPDPTISLSGVSCTAGPACTAVGSQHPETTSTATLAERN
jgi:hypothetical protein